MDSPLRTGRALLRHPAPFKSLFAKLSLTTPNLYADPRWSDILVPDLLYPFPRHRLPLTSSVEKMVYTPLRIPIEFGETLEVAVDPVVIAVPDQLPIQILHEHIRLGVHVPLHPLLQVCSFGLQLLLAALDPHTVFSCPGPTLRR